MIFKLPKLTIIKSWLWRLNSIFKRNRKGFAFAALIDLLLIIAIVAAGIQPAKRMISPLIHAPLQPIFATKSSHEVFGFAPHWNFEKLSNIDFKILTTLAYFGVDVYGDGTIEKNDPGYQTFTSSKATDLFKKAHANGTRVVLTLTQMNGYEITQLLDDENAQNQAIDMAVELVKKRGIDGINIDFEYGGDPGQGYRDAFTRFVGKVADKMHKAVPSSSVSVSVYAASVKDPKIYDIAALGKLDVKLFMMAYDFAVAGSDNAIPTAPLNGHESGKYWYDINTAVNDFLTQMSPEKLILGVPYYGYNYLVYEPQVKAETRPYYSWRGQPTSQTYSQVLDNIRENEDGVGQLIKGWDDDGKVGYVAYYKPATDTWRMVFMEDRKSLGLKYDFAKDKNLAGVGVWALGNDDGKKELWSLLEEKFGKKNLASSDVEKRQVADINED